ncbi:MAG: lipid A export permease/ATP-binding protein MsbA [Arenicellales bacterium]
MQVYRRLLKYVTPYRSVFVYTLIGMVVVAATQPLFPHLINLIIDDGFIGKDSEFIKFVPIYLISIFIVRGLASFISMYGMAWIGRNVIFDVRQDLFQQMIYLPVKYFDSHSSAQLISKVIYDVEQIATASTNAISTIIKDGLTVFLLLLYLAYLDVLLTLIFLITGPFIAYYVRFISKSYHGVSKSIQRSMGDITHAAKEAVHGQQILKIFGGYDNEISNFDRVNKNNQKLAMKKASVSAMSVPIVELFIAFSIAGLVTYMISQADQGSSSIGEFVAYITAVLILMPPLRRLIKINEPLQMGVAAISTIFKLLDEPTEIDDGGEIISGEIDSIEFRDIRFRYHKDEGMVLNDISFGIKNNSILAIVGGSGSGKTTITSLLLRFYDPDNGGIFINGIDIRKISLKCLRKNIAYVPQETILFDGTIEENIAYGCEGEISKTKLKRALEAAHVNEFVLRLKDGIKTKVGERGLKLSGGQRQRISIARAIYKDAPILILDEATSALDAHSERHVQQAMENLLDQRTTLVIAHRLSTVEHADNILVLEHGDIVEQGKHHELLRRNGAYMELYLGNFDFETDKSA